MPVKLLGGTTYNKTYTPKHFEVLADVIFPLIPPAGCEPFILNIEALSLGLITKTNPWGLTEKTSI